MRKTIAAAVGLGAIFSMVGCAQQVGDIDRTQPNKIQKEIFDSNDEWFMRSTVVSANGTAISSFAGLQGDMSRVRWKITEDLLVAHRTHEDVIGIDTNDYDIDEDGLYYGRPVAAFGISRHFDVQRQYNAGTGEQSNVIVENSSDRPWFDRDWMRIDWTRNQAPVDIDPAVPLQRNASININPQDQGDDIDWKVEYDENGDAYYLEVVNTYVIEPDWLSCVLTFGFPLYGGDCGPEEIEVRTSFLKAEKGKSKHAPRLYDDHELDKFGFFRTERCTYDRNYGCRDSTTVKLANIWRIWEDGVDADGNPVPYEQREVKPFAYYLTPGFPEELKETAKFLVDEWNDAFVSTVKHYKPDFDGRVYYLCDNVGDTSLTGDDDLHGLHEGYRDGVCPNPGTTKELGDLRYSFISWVDNQQQRGPLGYGPSSADPLTGELINGNANIYGAAIDSYAQYVLDIVRLMNDDIDEEEFSSGQYVKDFIDRKRDEGLFLGYNKYRKDFLASQENVKRRIENRESSIFDIREQVVSNDPAHRLDMLRMDQGVDPRVRWQKLRGTPIEQMMVTDEIKQALAPSVLAQLEHEQGLNTGSLNADSISTFDDAVLDQISPVRIGTHESIMGNANARFKRFASRNMMMADFFDSSYLGLANEIKNMMDNEWTGSQEEKNEQAYQLLRRRIFQAVMEHEVGHTLGLRHNFEGSFDAINFFPGYWKERFADYDGDGQVDMVDPTQPLNREQLGKGIREYQYSTIMDYGARLNADFKGIGSYDHAAIRYGYGELVDVFNTAPTKIQVDYSSTNWSAVSMTDTPISNWNDIDEVVGLDNADTPGDGRYDSGLDVYHYAVLPMMFGGQPGNMDLMYDRDTITKAELETDPRVEVPFRFCSDEYRGARPSCDVWDEGAAFDEIVDSHVRLYEQYYIFNNFRRDRAGWGLSPWGTARRYLTRYFNPIANIYQQWVIRLFNYEDEWYVSDWGGRTGWAGIERGLGTIMSTFVSPNPGTYGWDPNEEIWTNISNVEGTRPSGNSVYTRFMDVPVGEGKYDFSRFDSDSGYYYFLRTEILTSFFERWMALIALTNPVVNTIGVDTSSDVTSFSIPVTLLYNEQMFRWFGAMMNGDMSEVGPVITETNGKMGFEYQNPLATNFLLASYRNAEKVNPYSATNNNRSFNLELFSMIYGLAWFQDRFDRTFNSLANVMVLGHGDSYELKEGWETIEWTDPVNGVTYVAARSAIQRAQGFYPAGWNLVEHAMELDMAWRAEACDDPNEEDLSQCNDIVNSAYFELQNQREMLDVTAATNGILNTWNVPTWAL